MKAIFGMFVSCVLVSSNLYAEKLLLTGRIGSSTKQVVNAPSGSQQLQIQWMEEEGKEVEKGKFVSVPPDVKTKVALSAYLLKLGYTDGDAEFTKIKFNITKLFKQLKGFFYNII